MLTSAALGVAKAASTIATFITLPLVLAQLGAEQFGVWLTICSLAAVLSFSDLGIGNGLTTAVAQAAGRDDTSAIRRAFGGGVTLLSMAGLAVLTASALLFLVPEWTRFIGVTSPEAARSASAAALAFAVCFAIGLPAGAVQRLQAGLQLGFEPVLWQAAGSALLVGAIAIGVRTHASMALLTAALFGAPLIATAANTLILFLRRPELTPRKADFLSHERRALLHSGMLFLVLQIATVVACTSDNLVVARVLGSASVAHYALVARLFAAVGQIVHMVASPLWPAYAEALARGHVDWARAALMRSTVLAIGLAVTLSVILIVGGNQILKLWVGPGFDQPPQVFAMFGLWAILDAVGVSLFSFLFAAGTLKPLAILVATWSIICIAARVYLTNAVGIAGIPLATSVTYGLIVIGPTLVLCHRTLSARGELRTHETPA